MNLTIRPERAGDEVAIRRVTATAFAGQPHSDGSEPTIVDRLRVDGDLALSLVAEAADGIVGQVAFSPVSIADGSAKWYGLGPVSVLPKEQGRGIGSRRSSTDSATSRIAARAAWCCSGTRLTIAASVSSTIRG